MANGPKNIPGKAVVQGYKTDIDIDEVADDYEAYDKVLPAGLPGEVDGYKITWFNNFGVRKKNTSGNEKTVPRYKVMMQKPPEGRRLFIYMEELLELTAENGSGRIKYRDAGDNRIVFHLDAGDPPTGTIP
jgi:hypothetical protein